ncbi:MAG: hypothetical protein IKK84_00160 [Clostridia bacterium]|nr:hypothetical protein [Clostridia bacterium]
MTNVTRLPDSYNKNVNSNNYKLLQLQEEQFDKLREDIRAVFDMLDIEKASGKTLELYGDMVQQPRGALNDTQYKIMLKTKLSQFQSKGSFGDVMNLIVETFNCKPTDISIVEKGACTVYVAKLPLDVLVSAGLTTTQAVQLIKSLLPSGVTVEADYFEGTFELGAVEGENDITKGFAAFEGDENGGYLGATLGEDEAPLPI